jgi:aspartate carbamoyltransferase catalytic subunit
MRSFLGRDILSLKDFDRHEYFRVFEVAEQLEPYARDRRNGDLLKHKTLVTAFYQPSTRTRLATEAAMHRLGGHVTGFSDAKMTRAGDFYQEGIQDTVKMLEYYGDVIAMRHYQQGAPHEAAMHASVPVINCGDGWGEHPTQILTDTFTIWRQRGRLDGLTWVMIGDMRMRTMHSLSYALSKFDAKAYVIAPDEMYFLPDFEQEVRGMGFNFERKEHIEQVIAEADIVYMEPVVQPDYTKSRQEATDDKGRTPVNYQVTKKLLFEKAKSDAIVLHSLPRQDELSQDVDNTRFQRYWVEAYNGVLIRMSLLGLILGAAE